MRRALVGSKGAAAEPAHRVFLASPHGPSCLVSSLLLGWLSGWVQHLCHDFSSLLLVLWMSEMGG